MKRLLTGSIILLMLGSGSAQAVPGPDPEDEHSSFEVTITVRDAPNNEPFTVEATDTTVFLEPNGWDFGDRVAYGCAWIEFYQAGQELFEVAYHAVGDYPGLLRINDRYGLETEEDNDLPITDMCLEGSGVSQRNEFRADGSDHFPHGTDLVFYRDMDGEGASTGDEIARINYDENLCGNLYWTPGNDPAEAWLWWDEDGASDMTEHGDGLCGGGHMEPVAVVQARARSLGPGIIACATDAMDGDRCTSGPRTTAHTSNVTLRLRGTIRASGFVRVPGGVASCKQDRVVVVQRRRPTGWSNVGRDRTSETGRYSEHIRNRDGIYRAWVLAATLTNGDACQADVSPRRSYHS